MTVVLVPQAKQQSGKATTKPLVCVVGASEAPTNILRSLSADLSRLHCSCSTSKHKCNSRKKSQTAIKRRFLSFIVQVLINVTELLPADTCVAFRDSRKIHATLSFPSTRSSPPRHLCFMLKKVDPKHR